MALRFILPVLFLVLCSAVVAVGAGHASQDKAATAEKLVGRWEAKRMIGPAIRGTLTIERTGASWVAAIGGTRTKANLDSRTLRFVLPDDRGEFRGVLDPHSSSIQGHWIQPGIAWLGNRFATPVALAAAGRNKWRGDVRPLDDRVTMYLVVEKNKDGSIGAFVRNPEYNLGIFMTPQRVVREGGKVRLVGRYRWNTEETILAEGMYDSSTDRLSLHFPVPNPAGSYEFKRIRDDSPSEFYPRERTSAAYTYRPPAEKRDGWPVARLEDVGISRKPIETLINKIIAEPVASVHAPDIHGVLIARHGKLVLEEYFHGFGPDRPHDTRSASKSLSSTLIGIALHSGELNSVTGAVYDLLHDGAPPGKTDARKRRITIETLMTMSPGFDCDDRNSSSPGNEDVMQSQATEPDWHKYTLALPMVREPGEKSVYCSASANLLGAVIGKASGEWLPRYFHRNFAEPMRMGLYHMNLMPNGEAYMGGGIRWLPRDFLKLGQLMVNGGVWGGKRLLSEEFARRATSPLYESRGIHYGYAWWILGYPYKDKTVRAFYAGGNGGQYVFGIPDLDLVIAFFGGNYNDRDPIYAPRDHYVPKFILPAIDGD